MSFTQKLFTSFHSYPDGNTRIGELNRIWYDSNTNTLRIQLDTVTPGGTIIAGGGQSDYTLLPATETRLGGVKIGDNIYVDGEGKISVNLEDYATTEYVTNQLEQYNDLGNLSIGGPDEQTISGSVHNADIVLNPNGGSVQVPNLKVGDNGNILNSNLYIEAYITQYELVSIVDSSTGLSDNLLTGTYGNINGVVAPWTVFELAPGTSGIPISAIQINDILTGVGIVPSVVQDRGRAGEGDPAEWSNYVIVGLDLSSLGQLLPLTGAEFDLLRPLTKANFNVQSANDSDIFLDSRGLGDVIVNTNIVPVTNNISTLGTPTKRWKSIYLGPGTIYIFDETLGKDIAIGARDNLLYVQNGAGLSVGEFTLVDNQIKIADPTRDIVVGSTDATGYVDFNRPIRIRNNLGRTVFDVNREGLTAIYSPVSSDPTKSTLSIVGTSNGHTQPRATLYDGTLIHLTAQDGKSSRISSDSFGVGTYPLYAGRAARGTVDEPSAMVAGDVLSRFSAVGWGTTGYVNSISRIDAVAAENFTDTTAGTKFVFQNTPIGSATIQKSATVDSTGLSFVGAVDTESGITFRDNTRQITAAIQSDWIQTDNTKLDYIKNKPEVIQGLQGVQGDIGLQGVKGVDGTSVRILGSVSDITELPGYPTSYLGDIGDGYLNIVDGSLYFWDGAQWNDVGDIRGSQGVQGTQGTQGRQGRQGIQGIQGTDGFQGIQGFQGTTGFQGTFGSQGITGNQGIQGRQGTQGTLGLQGTTGEQGAQGITGNQGTQGIQGRQGIQGTQGTQGQQGTQGTQGTQGITGNQGTQGIQGTQGTYGATGDTGLQGTQGTQGILGNQGIQGRQGTQGTQGIQGIQGTQGTDGAQGTQGTQGIQGRQGIQGTQGTYGSTGNQGIQGIQGMQASQGIQGTQAAQGVQGIQGIGSTYGNLNSNILIYVQNSAYTLTSAKNTLLSPFGLTNGVTVISNTRYQYEMVFNLQANKAGVLSYALAANGGLVLAQHNYTVIGNKTTTIDGYTAGITMMSKNLTSLFTTAQTVADTNNTFAHYAIWGTIDVTTGGSLNFMISQDQNTPITWSVLAGAYVKLLPIGPIGADSANGTWS